MTSPRPAFQECTGSCHENVPAPKAVSSNLRWTDGLTLLARIEIVTILVHYQPSYNTSHYGNTGCGVFKGGGTKLGRFLPKNQHPQRKLLNFENWISGGLRSFQKSDF